MENTVYVKSFAAPLVDIREIMRYSLVAKPTPELDRLVNECLDEVMDRLTYKVCYCELPVTIRDDTVDLGFLKVTSSDLAKALCGYRKALLFAASIGVEIDRLIKKYSHIAPSKAVLFQAIGAERVESLCDVFCDEIKKEHKSMGNRFSPGYGDFSIEFQREIFGILCCGKNIGVSLGDNLIMSPSKSVTAVVGICD